MLENSQKKDGVMIHALEEEVDEDPALGLGQIFDFDKQLFVSPTQAVSADKPQKMGVSLEQISPH